MVYPYYKELQNILPNMNKGNFGLWYNKFVPIKDFDSCKVSDDKGNDNNVVSYYHDKYNKIQKDTIEQLLDKRHHDQVDFYNSLIPQYETVVFKAKLKTPLITGIGETHPHEVSMVFDHNMGIPYIPASGIKGIVRFSHALSLIDKIPDGMLIDRDKDGNPCPPYFNDEENWTDVPKLFGTQAQRGNVIFLDAYPEKVPDLHVDIMNPHYGDYYSDDQHKTPPADYLNPIPIKFLNVARGTVFVFRALVNKNIAGLKDKVETALIKALTEEGVGAKTAVGYGLFEILNSVVVKIAEKTSQPAEDGQKPVDKFIQKIRSLKPDEAGTIGSVINDAISKIETEEDKKAFAQAVKTHMGKAFKKSKAEAKLKPFLA